jgi:hypothetical protein
MSIRTLSPEAFLVWTADRGIGRDPQVPHSEHLVFAGGRGVSGYWPYPDAASGVPHFVGTLLSAVRPNDRYWVYPERGYWSLGRDAESWPQTRVWRATVHAIGVPAGLRGAVGFNSTDWNELCAMLFLQITLGPSVHIDTIVIPETGNAVLYFEHHNVVWGTFRDQAGFDAVVAAMDRAGYPLPTEPPDATFKPVPRMSRGVDTSADEA